MAGRPPKSVKTLQLEKGKLYGDQADREDYEPKSDLEPRCPDSLSDSEKKQWEYYSDILREYGLLKILPISLNKSSVSSITRKRPIPSAPATSEKYSELSIKISRRIFILAPLKNKHYFILV